MAYTPDGYETVEPLTDERKTEFSKAEQVLEAGKDYQAVIETNKGRLVVDLFEDDAPVTVNNFVFLARNHYYDGVVFHRVLEDFMAQAGDPTGTGRGGPGYTFGDETDNGRHHDGKGRPVDGERRTRHQRLAVFHHFYGDAVVGRQAHRCSARWWRAQRCWTTSPASTRRDRAGQRLTRWSRSTSLQSKASLEN